MSSLRFQLDLDRLGELIKADPNLIEVREYKDGTKHRMVKFSIMDFSKGSGWARASAVMWSVSPAAGA